MNASVRLFTRIMTVATFVCVALPNLASAVTLSLGVGQQEAVTFESMAQSVNVDRSGIVEVANEIDCYLYR
jgi:hypothetical protein